MVVVCSAVRRDNNELGRAGEDLAADHLRSQGYEILARNWCCRDGELDLVAATADLLVVAEVKTRSGREFGSPAAAVTAQKVARIRGLALQWRREQCLRWCPVRFDVIAIDWPVGGSAQVQHIVGAF